MAATTFILLRIKRVIVGVEVYSIQHVQNLIIYQLADPEYILQISNAQDNNSEAVVYSIGKMIMDYYTFCGLLILYRKMQ